MAILRVTAEWSGFSGAPGYSVFHFAGIDTSQAVAQAAADAVDAFIGGWAVHTAPKVSIRLSSAVDVIDEANGQMLDLLNITAPAPRNGPTSGSYSAVSGAVCHWLTSDVKNGRRVRGRNFLVPLGSSSYDTDGSLHSTTMSAIQTAADALVAASPDLIVWSRPSITGASDGSAHPVNGSRVPDMAAVLRSRRD